MIPIAAAPAGASVSPVAPGTATINTAAGAAGNGFARGNIVTIAGVAPAAAFNGTFTITGILGPNRFTYALPAGTLPPANSGGGTVTLVAAGGGAGGGTPALGTSFGRSQPYAAHSSQVALQVGTMECRGALRGR